MKLVSIALALALAVLPASAYADPPGRGGPQGNGKVPPGLAKKPGGLPPGQAKKIWGRGERLPIAYVTERTYLIPDYRVYRLPPPPPGHNWLHIDGTAYLADGRNGLIVNVIANFRL